MLLYPDVSGRIENGYSELNTGTWWEETQQLTPGLKVLPLIFYLDDTHLSRNGRASAKPFSMTIGIFPLDYIMKDESKTVLAYMPDMKGTAAQKKQKKYSAYKRSIYHKVLARIMESVKRAQQNYGCTLEMPWGLDDFMPYPVLIINDNPEGHLLTLVYDSAKACHPC